MYNIFIYIAVSVITAILAVVITVIIQKRSARTQAKIIVDEARQEAEMLKQKKMLEWAQIPAGYNLPDHACRAPGERLCDCHSPFLPNAGPYAALGFGIDVYAGLYFVLACPDPSCHDDQPPFNTRSRSAFASGME